MDGKGRPTAWTSYGDWVHLAAPGQDLWLPAGEDGYSQSSGTSWSCAIGTGAVALLLQANPKLTPPEIKQHLISTGDRPVLPRGRRLGPVLNAFYAVQAATPQSD